MSYTAFGGVLWREGGGKAAHTAPLAQHWAYWHSLVHRALQFQKILFFKGRTEAPDISQHLRADGQGTDVEKSSLPRGEAVCPPRVVPLITHTHMHMHTPLFQRNYTLVQEPEHSTTAKEEPGFIP